MLRGRVESYLEFSAIPKSVFCRRIGISYQYLRTWLKKETDISDELKIKIREYLDKYEVK